ncbi:sulfurtransferase TusA family protein [Sphingomonas jatrophae]|uniref:tRNA 2-thiouridine synthesizing protein A n=1 Tax=Sphingomonas jatrophae TaxID=1166337 RepID=A0A1I6LLQ7_9SPHN|nr:sulfurtransferase TusA family protein [Sphingomonas jatrophae]SFS04361.1 tRNA 2-thiouridine synthesizing protein A [Sphingomonas jatrophae]
MIEVDARGLRCPWPVLRLARAMRDASAVRITADDPAAAREIAALARERDWRLKDEGGAWIVSRSGPTVTIA